VLFEEEKNDAAGHDANPDRIIRADPRVNCRELSTRLRTHLLGFPLKWRAYSGGESNQITRRLFLIGQMEIQVPANYVFGNFRWQVITETDPLPTVLNS
jgi:hypothetical protein